MYGTCLALKLSDSNCCRASFAITQTASLIIHATTNNYRKMKNWEHLIQTGMAEMISPQIAAPALEDVLDRYRHFYPGVSDSQLAFIRNHFNVVQFKKNAVIIDYGQRNMQFMFMYSGKVRLFMTVNKKLAEEGWIMNLRDTIFVTHEPYTKDVSYYKLVVEEPAIFVTLNWDDHQNLSGMYPPFSDFTLGTEEHPNEEVNRRLRSA